MLFRSTPSAQNSGQESLLVSVLGLTPSHCSPEQVAGRQLDRRTDLWSWAVSVLQMFQGEVTWQSGSLAAQALEGYLEHNGEDESFIPPMPVYIAELLRQCFRLDVEERPINLIECAKILSDVYKHWTGKDISRLEPKIVGLTADSLNNRAASYLDLGKDQDAAKAWQDALRIDPGHLESTYNLSLIEWRTGKILDTEVVRRLEELRKVRPSKRAGYLLGLVHAERLDRDAAIKEFDSISGWLDITPGQAANIERLQRNSGFSLQTKKIFEKNLGSITALSISSDGKFLFTGISVRKDSFNEEGGSGEVRWGKMQWDSDRSLIQ